MNEREYAKRQELLNLVRIGKNVTSSIADQPVVDFVRYKRNRDAMKRIELRLKEMPNA